LVLSLPVLNVEGFLKYVTRTIYLCHKDSYKKHKTINKIHPQKISRRTYILLNRFKPIRSMIMCTIIRSIWVGTSRILSRLVTLFIDIHTLIEKNFIGWVMEVLGLEGYVWDDIEVVDYSVDFGDF
jgi:hypothetical protein